MLDPRELTERNLRAARRRDEDLAEHVRIGAVLRGVADPHREPPPAFNCRRQRRLADGRLDHLLNVAHPDAVSSGCRAIDVDVEILAAGDLLGIDVARTRYLTDDVRDTTCRILERREV